MKRQFVTFRVRKQLLGIDVLVVRELGRALEFTQVELAPSHVVGLANLRGQIVTVLDLASRLGISGCTECEEQHDIILKTEAELAPIRARDHRLDLATCPDPAGLRVDEIGDIAVVGSEHIEPVPANVVGVSGKFLLGVASVPAGLMLILDAATLLTAETDAAT